MEWDKTSKCEHLFRGTYIMKHHVFISYSSTDREVANAICHYLEASGIPCWIAPRDIDSGDWAGSIMKGIQKSDVFVVILSANSIPSPEVVKEVTEATRVCQYILPFKIDDELLDDRMRYHLGPVHWLDAVTPPMEARIEELKERIISLTQDGSVYANKSRQKLLGTTVMPKSFFVGREEEILQIHELLKTDHVLFLQGMGGIGKSEIAKGYASTYAKDYDKVLFANYRDSIVEMIIGEDIVIENFKRNTSYGQDAESNEAFFKRKLQAIKDLSNEKTLLIVDNFDVKHDEQLEQLVAGPYKLIFTTRYAHKEYPSFVVGPIQNFDTLRLLFKKNYGDDLSGKDLEIVDDIIRLVNGHTITIELIAKQMEASFLSPEEMLELLQTSGTNSGLEEEVEREGKEKSAFDFIKDLFHLSSLSEEEQYIMKNMCLVPYSGIHVRRLKNYLELKNLNIINQLVSKSWLMLDKEINFIKMHPIISDVVKDALKPSQHNCQQYIMGLWNDCSGFWFQTIDERAEKWPYIDHIQRYYGEPTKELYKQYADFANHSWVCSHFEESFAATKRVYDFALREFGDAGYQPAYAARTVAGAYFNAGDEKSAEPYYYLALEHLLKNPEGNYYELGFCYEKVGRCETSRGNFDKAKEYFDLSLAAHKKAKDDGDTRVTPISHVDTNVHLGRMYIAMGEYEKALEYCQIVYDDLFKWKNEEVTSHTYCLSDSGICYSMLGEYDKADEYLQRALALNIRFNGEASMVTVRTRESIADNYVRQGKIEEAKRIYLMLELELEKSFGSSCPQVARLREKNSSV